MTPTSCTVEACVCPESKRSFSSLPALAFVAALALLGGCSHGNAPATSVTGHAISGVFHGGQQPITGALVQLYAVGTTGDASAATPLLTATVKTDDTGSFSITGDYTCPSPGTQVYLLGTGGNPGLAAGTNNTAIALLAPLGACGSLGPSTFISLNELTTVAAANILAPWMTSGDHLGSGPSDLTQFEAALAKVNEYVDLGVGTVPGPTLPSGYYASSVELATIANILSTCANSTGGTAYDGTACGDLFALTTPRGGISPTNILEAAISIALHPTNNVVDLFEQSPAIPPFQPTLSYPPANWSLPIIPYAATPTFSLAGGNYTSSQTVTITSSTPGASIYYTTNGTTPTILTNLYTGPIAVSATETVKAISTASGYEPSLIGAAAYTITTAQAAAPTFSLTPGWYGPTQTFPLTDTTPGAVIFYTLDGSNPTSGSIRYTGPISLSSSTTVKAIAVASGYSNSAVSSCSYLILITPATPTISPAGGNYSSPVNVALIDSYSDIFYTTDGSTPTLSSTRYSGGTITVSSNMTIKAIAFGNFNVPSDVASATYNFLSAATAPTFSPAPGSYTSAQTVTLSDTTSGATVYYTADGTLPSTGSTLYTGAITVSASTTISAIAVASGYTSSAAATGAYSINQSPGTIFTIAGTGLNADLYPYSDGTVTYGGDGTAAVSASLGRPEAIARDSSGNLYFSDYNASAVRKITPAGLVSTVYPGQANGLAVDTNGNLYLGLSSAILKIAPTGETSTFLDNVDSFDIKFDSAGNLYSSAYGYVVKITPGGVVTTVAGNGNLDYSGDGGQATHAGMAPRGIALDAAGNLYIADVENQRIRKVTPDGIISTVAGTGATVSVVRPGSLTLYYGTYNGDGIPATTADLNFPSNVVVDPAGNLYIADSYNQRIRMVDPSGTISTIAGTGTAGFGGDYGPATSALLNYPNSLLVDGTGTVYFSDASNNRIREISHAAAPLAPPTISPTLGAYHTAQTVTLSPAAPGESIYYTTDGSLPTTSSTLYTGPITVSASETIYAIATASGSPNSLPVGGAYTITYPGIAPVLSPGGYVYDTPQTVTITDATPGATISYTINTSSGTRIPYTGPITVSRSEGIYAFADAPGYEETSTYANYQINLPQAATPTFSSAPGTYTAALTVTLGDSTPGAAIYYTTDNSTPTTSSTLYTSAITVSTSETIKAIAVANGYTNSAVGAASYVISLPVATPIFSSPGGTYPTALTVTLSDTTPGAIIYYTLDGSTPGTYSTRYTGPIAVFTSHFVINAIAAVSGSSNSAVATATYILTNPQIVPPVINIPDMVPESYLVNPAITISLPANYCALPSSIQGYSCPASTTFYYSFSIGETPTTLYTGPIVLTQSTVNLTISVIAKAPGYPDSAVISNSERVSVQAAAPAFSLASGAYTSPQTLTLTSNLGYNNVIFYTTDGSNPTTSSTAQVCTGPITISSSETISAYVGLAPGQSIADGTNGSSSVSSATYVIEAPTAPVFLPAAGTYPSAQTVTISDATAGAAIYYTTDGSAPTTSSTLYGGPFPVSTSETIRAIAVAGGVGSTASTAGFYINPDGGIIRTFAGNGTAGYNGDGIGATTAEVNATSVAMDANGNVYFADSGNQRIRKVTPEGVISTVAGNGTIGFSGDGGLATDAELSYPHAVVVDPNGNLYIADSDNSRIRKVSTTGIITTFAGSSGFSLGDGGLATSAKLQTPFDVALDSLGNVYIAETGGFRIRKVDTSGIITTFAGNGTEGFGGDGGAATNAKLDFPEAIVVDVNDNLYIADTENNRIRMVTPTGIISTVAGNGTIGYHGDGLAATSAWLNYPHGVTVDTAGNFYISDTGNNVIRKVTPGGIISTIAGNHTGGFSGEDFPALTSEVNQPGGLTVDGTGNVYIADVNNNRIRKITYNNAATPTFTPAAGIYTSTQAVSLSSATPGAAIYYTTDGSTPTSASTLYTGPISVSASETIKAVAFETGYSRSVVGTSAYVVSQGPALLVSPSSLTIIPLAGATSPVQTVTVTNTTSSTISFTSIALSGGASSLYTLTNGCGSTLAPQGICTLGVTFSAPPQVYPPGYASSVQIVSNLGTTSVSLLGYAGYGVLSLSANSINFGTQTVNTTSPAQTIVVSNSGNYPLTVDGSMTTSERGPYNFLQSGFSGAGCPSANSVVIPVGGSCTWTFYFAPKSVGPLGATLNFQSNGASTATPISLSGTGQ